MYVAGALGVGLPMLATAILVLFVRRFKPMNGFETGTTDIEGFYITALAAIYAVILAFMVFVVWTKYDVAENNVDAEASGIADVLRLTHGLPAPFPSTFASHCRSYAVIVQRDEWPALAQRKFCKPARLAMDRLWDDLYLLQQDRTINSVILDHIYDRVTRIEDLRRSRLRASRTVLPPVLWVLLYFGGLLTVFFAAIFHVELIGQHLLKAIALTALIFMVLFVIQALDHPFQGPIRIAPTAFHALTLNLTHGGAFHR